MKTPLTEEWLQLLGSLMYKGYAAEHALELLQGHPNELIADQSRRVLSSYRESGDLPASVAHHIDVFPEDLRLLLAEVEGDSSIGQVLKRFVQHRQEIRSLFGLLRNASALDGLYLLAVLVFSMVLLAIYSLFVLPQMRELFEGIGDALPPFTAAMFELIEVLGYFWWLVPILGALTIWAVLKRRGWLAGKATADPPLWAVRLPFWGGRLRLLVVARAVSMFQTLIGQGVGLERSLSLSRAYATGHAVSLDHWLLRVLGRDWEAQLKFLQACTMLDSQIEHVSKQVFDQVAAKLLRYTRIKSIVALMLIALFVGAWVIAMYLPIFQMSSFLGGAAL